MTQKRQVKIGTPIRIAVLYLSGLGQLLFGFLCMRLCAVETNSVTGRLMAQLCRKCFNELIAFEGRLQTLSCSLFLCYKETQVLATKYFNISMKVTNFIAFLWRV
jgi:hypothetical protein